MVSMQSESRRFGRSPWSDIRFLVGIVLVLAAVGGVWAVVAAARQTTPVYVASRTIVPGETVTAADLTVAEVSLGVAGDAYLGRGDLIDGVVAARTLGQGELVPRESLVPEESASSTVVVVRSSIEVPASVGVGSVVELWSAPRLEQGRFDTPRILVADATVVRVDRDDSPLAGGAASVELVIPRADVPAALAAAADGAALSIIPWGPSQR